LRYAPSGVLVGGMRIAIETGQTPGHENAKKSGAYPPVHCIIPVVIVWDAVLASRSIQA